MKEKLACFKSLLFDKLKKERPLLFAASILAAIQTVLTPIVIVYLLCLGYIPVKYVLLLLGIALAALALQYILISKAIKNAPGVSVDTDNSVQTDISSDTQNSEADEDTVAVKEETAEEVLESASETSEESVGGDGAAVAVLPLSAAGEKREISAYISLAAGTLATVLLIAVFGGMLGLNGKIKKMTDNTYYSTYVVYTLKDTVEKHGKTDFNDLFDLRYYADENYQKLIKTTNGIENPVMGINTFVDSEDRSSVEADLASQTDKVFTDAYYYSFPDMAKGLLDGETDYIIMQESMTEYILEEYPDFLDSAEVVYRENIKKEVTEAEKNPITTEPFVIYVCGLDTFGEVPDEGGGDVNILLFVDPEDKEVVMVSTPRDMYVPVNHNPNKKDKLTNVGRYGSFNSLMGSLEDLYDIDIDYYVKTNFTCFMNIIDAIGGITVTPTEDFKITGITTGSVMRMKERVDAHLSGEMALAYVRERKQLTRGDRSRAENGQAVFMAIFSKLTGDYCESGIYDYYNVLLDNIKTNIKPNDSQALLDMQIIDRAVWSFKTAVMEGSDLYTKTPTSSGIVYVMVPDEDRLDEIKDMIKDVMED